MSAAGDNFRHAAGRLLGPLAIAWAVLAGIGYYPTLRWAGAGGPTAMLAGQALVFIVAAATGLAASRRMSGRDAGGRFAAVFGAGVVRLAVTAPAAGVIALSGAVRADAFLIWVAIAYVVMIQTETVILVRWSRRLETEK